MNRLVRQLKKIWVTGFFWFSFSIKNGLSQSEFYFICPGGLGDTFIACLLAEEFLKNHPGKKINLIIKPGQKDIPVLFPTINKIYFLPPQDPYQYNLFKKPAPGKLFFCHPRVNPQVLAAIGKDNFTLFDAYRTILKLPANREQTAASPQISPALRNSALEKFKNYNLPPGKTAILCPQANSLETLPLEFWEKLAQNLKKNNWTVCTNVIGKEVPVKDTVPINFSIAEAIPFAELAGRVIALRSGLCDILSSAEIRLEILYPDQPWCGGTIFSGASLKLMKISKNAREYILDKNNLDKTINDLSHE
jgi:hypothetical protein